MYKQGSATLPCSVVTEKKSRNQGCVTLVNVSVTVVGSQSRPETDTRYKARQIEKGKKEIKKERKKERKKVKD